MSEPMEPVPAVQTTLDDRLPWSPPALSDLGAVVEATQGLSYTPGDGISNLTPLN